jgi:hypothetical protein
MGPGFKRVLRHIVGEEGFRTVERNLRLVTKTAVAFVAEGDGGESYDYAREGFSRDPPDIRAEEWLGVEALPEDWSPPAREPSPFRVPKTGEEVFHRSGAPLQFLVVDFWRWSASDLISNALRGRVAEYLVAQALGVSEGVRSEWDSFDLQSRDGIRVEVKSAAYVQTWKQRSPHNRASASAPPGGGAPRRTSTSLNLDARQTSTSLPSRPTVTARRSMRSTLTSGRSSCCPGAYSTRRCPHEGPSASQPFSGFGLLNVTGRTSPMSSEK